MKRVGWWTQGVYAQLPFTLVQWSVNQRDFRLARHSLLKEGSSPLRSSVDHCESVETLAECTGRIQPTGLADVVGSLRQSTSNE